MPTRLPSENWIEDHRYAWTKKAGLRFYYRVEIFERIVDACGPGNILELGSGPGFFGQFGREVVNTDVSASAMPDVVTDAHALAFADAIFDNVVGIDVLHHLAHPKIALEECRRVLKPLGRLILVEPWAAPLGSFVYRNFHHEDCSPVPDPWRNAVASDDPMAGNSAIPFQLFRERRAEFGIELPGLRMDRIQPFGGLSYLATGGFQGWGLPAGIIRMLAALERAIPRPLMMHCSLRALIVLQRVD